jgi:hypothetical protein
MILQNGLYPVVQRGPSSKNPAVRRHRMPEKPLVKLEVKDKPAEKSPLFEPSLSREAIRNRTRGHVERIRATIGIYGRVRSSAIIAIELEHGRLRESQVREYLRDMVKAGILAWFPGGYYELK